MTTTWTAPRTWVTDEVVTAALMNTHVRDNELHLHEFHGCRCTKSAAQTVASAANDVVSFNTETFDTNAHHDNVTNNSRFVVPTGFDGYWRFHAQIRIDADAAVDRRVTANVRKNAAGASGGGTSIMTVDAFGSTVTWGCRVDTIVLLAAADYLELFFESFTEARDLQAGAGSTTAEFMFLGA